MSSVSRLTSYVFCSQIPVIYYDSSDESEGEAGPSSSPPPVPPLCPPPVTPLCPPPMPPLCPPPPLAVAPGAPHPLERGSEVDVQTPESPDLPMADTDLTEGSGSSDSLAPRARLGLSGTIV